MNIQNKCTKYAIDKAAKIEKHRRDQEAKLYNRINNMNISGEFE